MSMNVGSMLKALVGDIQPSDIGKAALELKVGQIVRGVLIEMLDQEEAVVNIGGVNVRAKLDAELPVGRGTLLQVQPSSGGGTITLKPLPDMTDAVPDEGLEDVLKSFGLPEQKGSFELLRGLKRDGYPIDKDTASFFSNANALKPAGTDAQQWASAADVAFRRGLPPTETTLSSLRQALFGQPLHETLSLLQSELAGWLGQSSGSDAQVAIGRQLQSLLAQGQSLLEQGNEQRLGETSSANVMGTEDQAAEVRSTSSATAAAANAASASAEPESDSAAATATPRVVTSGQATATAAAGQDQTARPDSASTMKAANARTIQESSLELQGNVMPNQAKSPGEASDAASAARTSASTAPNAASSDTVAARSVAFEQAPQTAPGKETAWIGRFLQWLGAGHERQALHVSSAEGVRPTVGDDFGGASLSQTTDPSDSQTTASHSGTETLKSALLNLVGQDNVPQAVRDTAQTLLNQITGQQLLLTSEQSADNLLSHMTLFVPMKGADGETTATIHVQTRRSRKGEWDASNCRLLFDLRMRNIGDTVVDVQVVDRIVSLKLLSDFPGMNDLLSQAREEAAEGMRSAGYQLSSLSAAPLPKWKDGSTAQSAGTSETQSKANLSATRAYAAKPYKGVDFRV